MLAVVGFDPRDSGSIEAFFFIQNFEAATILFTNVTINFQKIIFYLRFSLCLLALSGYISALSIKMQEASSSSARKVAYAAERNKDPIADVLKNLNPVPRRIFEVSSGTGEHAETLCNLLKDQLEVYQPSEMDVSMFESIIDWTKEHSPHLCKAPIVLDVLNGENVESLERGAYDCLININMIHISPKETTNALFSIANRVLDESGVVLTYGPYRVGGEMVESNVAFDASLKSRNIEWGIRDLEWVSEEAERNGFKLDKAVSMPANNLSCLWKRAK